jgi:tetratricopeptide (TPR) repeat protein
MIILLFAGLVGGCVAAQRDCSEHKIRLPRTGRRLELGIIGDALIGATTSLAMYGAAVASTLISVPQDSDPHLFLKLGSFGIITGFAGIQLLSGISSSLVRDVQGVKERVQSLELREKSLSKTIRADFLRENDRFEESEKEFSEALRLDPDNDLAVIGLAKVFRRLNRLDQAVQLLTEFIDRSPSSSRAIYNRACYKLLLGQRSDAISDLKRAAQISPDYCEYAKKDQDFASLWSDPEFLRITAAP